MIEIKPDVPVENKKATELVIGNLAMGVFFLLVALFFHMPNVLGPLAFTLAGVFIGIWNSKRNFKHWSFFVEQTTSENTKKTNPKKIFSAIGYSIIYFITVQGLRYIENHYIKIPYEWSLFTFEWSLFAIEFILGWYLGYFLWLWRLYKRSEYS